MLKKFEVKNYRNFKEKISIDFSKVGGYQFSTDCISNQMIAKMLIYGKNSTGKTNLGEAVTDIKDAVVFPGISEPTFLNADSDESYAEFYYSFLIDGNEIEYTYRKTDSVTLCYEELRVNDSMIFTNNFIPNGVVISLGNELISNEVNIDRYVEVFSDIEDINKENGNLPFLRWLINNTVLAEDSILLKFYTYVRGIHFVPLLNTTVLTLRRHNDNFFKLLEHENNLRDFEDFLNVMGVKCKLAIEKLPDGSVELYFKHEKMVPFLRTASSGTLALLNIYRRFYGLKNASLLYIDEFDAFYHYEMSEKMISYLKTRFPECQIILTTHNTNLMTNKIMRPDCLFILSTLGTLTPLCAATERELREGHNLEKMYISGEFADYE